MTDSQELLEMARRCEDRALYNTSGDPMRLLKDAAGLMRRHVAQAEMKCARCGSSGDTYVLCSGCGAPAQAPWHTDLMVAPESIDAIMEANPLPDDAQAQREIDPMRLLKEAAALMRRHARAEAPRQENDDVFPGFRGNNDGG